MRSPAVSFAHIGESRGAHAVPFRRRSVGIKVASGYLRVTGCSRSEAASGNSTAKRCPRSWCRKRWLRYPRPATSRATTFTSPIRCSAKVRSTCCSFRVSFRTSKRPGRHPTTARSSVASPRSAASSFSTSAAPACPTEIDVRHVLPAIRVPTLILHRTAEQVIDVANARYMAEHIPSAKLIELAGIDHNYLVGGRDALLDEVEVFLTGARHVHEPERVLATVLFADIVGSTERAAALGDHSWRELLEAFYAKARAVLQQYRGREINTSGDGFLASFDGPARAIRCAGAIRDTVRSLGLEVRCGLHTGECELVGNDIAGIAVHIGARVGGLAAAGEVLVSQTVHDLVAGSGLAFEERGTHTLKGVPNAWHLFRA